MMLWLMHLLAQTPEISSDSLAHGGGVVGYVVAGVMLTERIQGRFSKRNSNGHSEAQLDKMIDKLDTIIEKLAELNGRLSRGD